MVICSIRSHRSGSKTRREALDKAGGTLQNLAYCYETIGAWASAYARYEELGEAAKHAVPPRPDRVALAQEHLQKIRPLLSRVTFHMLADRSAVDVRVDGARYDQVAWSTGLLLDPGKHAVVVSAPGKVPYRTSIAVRERTNSDVTIPPLAAAPKAAAVTGSSSNGAGQRRAGIVIGAVGAAGVVTGAVFGVLTFVARGDAASACQGNYPTCSNGPSTQGDVTSANDCAGTYGTVADVALGVGAAALATGVVLYLLAPSSHDRVGSSSLRVEF